jgi:hypothetical protein
MKALQSIETIVIDDMNGIADDCEFRVKPVECIRI